MIKFTELMNIPNSKERLGIMLYAENSQSVTLSTNGIAPYNVYRPYNVYSLLAETVLINSPTNKQQLD